MKHIERLYALYDFIAEYQQNYDEKPSYKQMAIALNLPLPSISLLLKNMERLGMIQRPDRRQIVLRSRVPDWNGLITPLPGETLISQ